MIKKFLFSRYEFRVNLLRNQTEWRTRWELTELPEPPFHPLTDRDLNTFYWELQEAGISQKDELSSRQGAEAL